MAIQRRRPGAGLIHHSDRGSQYAASEYRDIPQAAAKSTPPGTSPTVELIARQPSRRLGEIPIGAAENRDLLTE
jgi:hypothetical protein